MWPNAHARKLLLFSVLDRFGQFFERELAWRERKVVGVLVESASQKIDGVVQVAILIVVYADESQTLAHDLLAS